MHVTRRERESYVDGGEEKRVQLDCEYVFCVHSLVPCAMMSLNPVLCSVRYTTSAWSIRHGRIGGEGYLHFFNGQVVVRYT